MKKKVRMADIAAQLNVSVVSVSKALSGKNGVSYELREKVKRIADDLGYVHLSATKNDNSKSYTIGVIVPERHFGKYVSFYWKMYQEVISAGAQKQCFTLIEIIKQEDENNLIVPKLAIENKADGIIIMGQLNKQYIYNIGQECTKPVICLDFFDETQQFDSIISNGFYGTYILTNYLFEIGHQNIAFVGSVMYTSSITERFLGFSKSMMEHGIFVTDENTMNDRDKERGDVSSYQFEFPKEMPTAFVCNCDLTASVLIRALNEKGYRVPEDASVVGYDNYLYPGLCDLGITTYDVNVKEMAAKSIDFLIERMNYNTERPITKIIDGAMIYKESVRKINHL